MITDWIEVESCVFKEELLKKYWDLSLGDTVIEVNIPILRSFGTYGGVFLGLSSKLGLDLFDKLVIKEFPGLSMLRKSKEFFDKYKPETSNRAYNSVLSDIIIGVDFPLFLLTAYSYDTKARLYPISNNETDNNLINSLFSFNMPKLSISKINRGALYVKRKNKKYIGEMYLSNYIEKEDDEPLYLSYRLWDIESFKNLAKNLKDDVDIEDNSKVREYMIESCNFGKSSNQFYLLDDEL